MNLLDDINTWLSDMVELIMFRYFLIWWVPLMGCLIAFTITFMVLAILTCAR